MSMHSNENLFMRCGGVMKWKGNSVSNATRSAITRPLKIYGNSAVYLTCSELVQLVQNLFKENIKALYYWSFVWGTHRWPVDFPHRGPVMRKLCPCHDTFHNVSHMSGKCFAHSLIISGSCPVAWFQRIPHKNDIKRIVLFSGFLEKEIKKDEIPILDTGENPEAPPPREMIELEVRENFASWIYVKNLHVSAKGDDRTALKHPW